MKNMSLSNIFILPILTLIAIPLAISAWFTVSIAIAALVVRLSVIYIELSYALITSYFALPITSHSSLLLTFTPSEPASPTLSTSPERHRLQPSIRRPFSQSSTSSLHLPSGSCSPTRPGVSRRSSSRAQTVSRSLIRSESRRSRPAGAQQQQQQTCSAASISPFAALRSLISGDEGRDFEGVGGWRLPHSSSSTTAVASGAAGAKHRLPGSSASSTSAPSVTDEADERAWLSINQRLELPSPQLTMHGNAGPFGEHPTTPGGGSLSSSNSWSVVSRPSPPESGPGHGRQRHHKRSMTTSVLGSASHHLHRHHQRHDTDLRHGVANGVGAEAGVSMSVPMPQSNNDAPACTQPLSTSAPSTPSTGVSGLTRMTTATSASLSTSDAYRQGQSSQARNLLTSHGEASLGSGEGTNGAGGDGGGYFALRRPTSSTGSPATTPQTIIVAEDVPITDPEHERHERTRSNVHSQASRTGRILAHYPASVRYYHRRRSLSGSTSNSTSTRADEPGTRPSSWRGEEMY